MAKRNDNTASFMLRFTQNIFEAEDGQSDVQWRGRISHVQGGEQKNFTKVDDALGFIQDKLSDLTKSSIEEKPAEEQEGILSKSFEIWKNIAKTGPKILREAIKDPKGQVTQIQEQIQEQFSQVSGEISKNMEINDWRAASKNDFQLVLDQLESMSSQISALNAKVDKLSAKKPK